MLEVIYATLPNSWPKYSLAALNIQFKTSATLSPNAARQVMWHRFVNSKGGMGNNIPCDLYNEHINKLVKHIIQNMGPNLTEKSLQRAVRSVSTLHSICTAFDNLVFHMVQLHIQPDQTHKMSSRWYTLF